MMNLAGARRNLRLTVLLMAITFAGMILAGCSGGGGISSDGSPGAVASEGFVANRVDVGAIGSNQSAMSLIAGQSIDAGTVSFEDIDTDGDGAVDSLTVTYDTKDGWVLDEVHFWIGASLADMPQTRSGNPKVGNFPYVSGSLGGSTSYRIVIPFSTLGFACPGPEDYLVAAHAAVRKANGDGTFRTETGWGDGLRLVQRGNWAMYSTIFIICDVIEKPPVEVSNETAFAYGGGLADCFQNYEEFLDNPKRWGWTNGPLSAGSYTFDLYAGAGLCDLSKGTLVGTVTVDYSGSTATVTYTTSGVNPDTMQPYTLEEAHLYVGSEKFARNKQGDFTLAPGQYPSKVSELADGTISQVFTVSRLSGDIYVVAHAVVSGFPK